MSARIIRISYLAFSLVYFLVAFLLFESKSSPGQNVLASIFSSLANTLYWVGASTYFLLSLLVSSIVGMLYFFKRNKSTFKIFRNISIACVTVFLIMLILSAF